MLKLKLDLNNAATAKVRIDHSNKAAPIPNLAELVEDTKEEFVAKAKIYLVFLLESFLGHLSLNTDIVKGMASFDPHVLLSLHQELATFCFTALYRSFKICPWLEGSPETDCRGPIFEFVDHFRHTYAYLKYSPGGFNGMVDLLSTMPEAIYTFTIRFV